MILYHIGHTETIKSHMDGIWCGACINLISAFLKKACLAHSTGVKSRDFSDPGSAGAFVQGDEACNAWAKSCYTVSLLISHCGQEFS